ncbi:MAG TPA: hypothetical protein VHU88_04245 [Sporichthyaceae bacterium]|nr:hypothetical protein [Sporichthyaceae bacterium]
MPSIKRTAAAAFVGAAIVAVGAVPASAASVESQAAVPSLAPAWHHHHHGCCHPHHEACWESWRCDMYGGFAPYWGGGDCGCGDFGWLDDSWDLGWGFGGFGGFGDFGGHGFGGHLFP